MIFETLLLRRARILKGSARSRTSRVWVRGTAMYSVPEISEEAAPVAVRAAATNDMKGRTVDVRVLEGAFLRPMDWRDLEGMASSARADEMCRAIVCRVEAWYGLDFTTAADHGDKCDSLGDGEPHTMVHDTKDEMRLVIQGWIDRNLVVVGGTAHLRAPSPRVRLSDVVSVPSSMPDDFAEPYFPADGLELWTCGKERYLEAFSVLDPDERGNLRDWVAPLLRSGGDALFRIVRNPPTIIRPDLVEACRDRQEAVPNPQVYLATPKVRDLGMARLIGPSRTAARVSSIGDVPPPLRSSADTIAIRLPFGKVGHEHVLRTYEVPFEDSGDWTEAARLGQIKRRVVHREGRFMVDVVNGVGRPIEARKFEPGNRNVSQDRWAAIANALFDEAQRLSFGSLASKKSREATFARAAGIVDWDKSTEADLPQVFGAFCRNRLAMFDGRLMLRVDEPWIGVHDGFQNIQVSIRWSGVLLDEARSQGCLIYPLDRMDEAMAVAGRSGKVSPSLERKVEILDPEAFGRRSDDLANLCVSVSGMISMVDRRVRLVPDEVVDGVVEASRRLVEAVEEGIPVSLDTLDAVDAWLEAIRTTMMEGCVFPEHAAAAGPAVSRMRVMASSNETGIVDDDELANFSM